MSTHAKTLSQRLQAFWFDANHGLLKPHERAALWAAEGLFRLLLWFREKVWVGLFKPAKSLAGVRVLAVGNLIVGGAGKTPTVMALSHALVDMGLRTGLLSRGYKSEAEHGAPRVLTPADLAKVTAQEAGDEAWLLCWRTQLPVAIGKDRYGALLALKNQFPDLQVAILDDGIAQRSLRPDQQLLVLDSRGFGNGHCLPLGPLREPAVNLQRFDAWIDNGFSQARQKTFALPAQGITLEHANGPWVNVAQWQSPAHWLDFNAGLEKFRAGKILAVAGIAVPDRFFESLRGVGLQFDALALEDHDPQLVSKTLRHCQTHSYDAILMTEKDAVKFFHYDHELRRKMWALRKQSQLDSTAIERLMHGRKTS